jgi:radical SAM enzyme (TIGR01210 family)
MGNSAESPSMPHYYLHRRFLEDQDLLIILNTKRCRYRCSFCDLPQKSAKDLIGSDDIVAQFLFVMSELKNSLSILDCLTLSNEGSVLDTETFPKDALLEIVGASSELRTVGRVVLETRLEFATRNYLDSIAKRNRRARIDILTGFETLSAEIRHTWLKKQETVEGFLAGLDEIANGSTDLTAYVLYKPDPFMNDEEAFQEALDSIRFLVGECQTRTIPLTIRLNPMYAAANTKWASRAAEIGGFVPPRLSDVLDLGNLLREKGTRVYIGLTAEGLADESGTFRARDDYSRQILKEAIRFNSGR